MTTLEHDLARWEAGELSAEELRRLHPDAKVVSLVDLYARLSGLSDEPVRFSEERWESLRGRLPARAPRRSERLRRLVTRPLVAAVAAVTMTGAVAYAASPAVRHQASQAWHDVFGPALNAREKAPDQASAPAWTAGLGGTRQLFPHGRGRGSQGFGEVPQVAAGRGEEHEGRSGGHPAQGHGGHGRGQGRDATGNEGAQGQVKGGQRH